MAINDFASPEKEKPITIDVLDNDMLGDCDRSTIGVAKVTNPANGTAELVGKDIKYTPNPNFYGTDSFTYKIICDAQESTATVNIVVNSLLKVTRLNHAQEPNTAGKFIIEFIDGGFSLARNLKVNYTITPIDATIADYIAPTGTATITAGQSSTEVSITPNNNYKVEGNNRAIEITITSAEIE